MEKWKEPSTRDLPVIRNMATYRGAVVLVVMEIMYPVMHVSAGIK